MIEIPFRHEPVIAGWQLEASRTWIANPACERGQISPTSSSALLAGL
jgi:hypothetical protein